MFRENSDNSRKQKDVDYTNGKRRGEEKFHYSYTGKKNGFKKRIRNSIRLFELERPFSYADGLLLAFIYRLFDHSR